MNNQAFDEQIRRAVENIDTNYKPETWDLLEQRLNTILPQHEVEEISVEEQFDAIIRKKMSNREPAYNQNHWIIMSSILDEYQSVRAWLVRYRVLEAALTVLFLLTFINVFYTPVQFSNANATVFEELKTPTASKNNLAVSSSKVEQNIAVISSIENNNYGLNKYEQKDVEAAQRIEENAISTVPTPTHDIALLEQPPFLPNLVIPYVQENKSNKLIISKINIKNNKLKYRIGLAVGFDIDRVFTPDFYSYGTLISAFSQTRYNFNTGFLMDLKKNRWAFETGLLYTKKSYSPVDVRQDVNDLNISTAAYKTDLATIKVNIVQLPTMLHFDFVKRNRWDLYLAAGVTTNFITQAKYDYSRQFLGYVSRPVFSATPTIEPPAKSFNDGIFETKSTIGNVFFTANAGLGANYRLTPKFNLYTQMIYRGNLSEKGIGPNNDKINSASLLLGFKKEF